MSQADPRRGPGTSPRPRDVPGYADAAARGLVPRVPTSPPRVEGPTAAAALRHVFVLAAVSVIAVVATVLLGADDGRLGLATVGLVLAVTAVGTVVTGTAVRRFGVVQLAELGRGYTTVTYEMGRWWMRAAPDGPVTNGWIPWDWRGTWVLRPTGEVVTAPDTDLDAPGLYPSPAGGDALELWTGRQWSGYAPRRRPA